VADTGVADALVAANAGRGDDERLPVLSIERRGAVAVIRYHHPPRNFLTLRAVHELRRAWCRLERDPTVRVIVLAGGALHTEIAELRALLASTPPLPAPLLSLAIAAMRAAVWLLVRWPALAALVLAARSERALVRSAMLEVMVLCETIERSRRVTIAAIDGPCVGGGLELALCFDQRIAIDDPTIRIGCPEILIGLIPGFGGTQRLARLVGPHRALALLLTGELLTVPQAVAAGIVDRAVPDFVTIDALADRLARRPPRAVAALSRAVRLGARRSLGRGLALELREVAQLARTRETRSRLDHYAGELAEQLARPVDQQATLAELAELMERASYH
jgi:enoyl-CoA hydratase